MKPSERGAVPKRMIAIQLAILASLSVFYFLYLPYRTKSQAEAAAQERELKIEALFQSLVVEDTHSEVEGTGTGGKVQRLNRLPDVDEFVRTLGLPDRRTTDFRGALHITWMGTEHSLEAAFDGGRLYCLRRENLRTGHGALVFESGAAWHPF